MATSPSAPILVTGAGGFVGQAVLRVLNAGYAGRRVVGLDRVREPANSVACDAWHVLDLGDAGAVRDVLAAERPSMVFHMAGLARGSDWDELYRANVVPTLVLLEGLREIPLDCVVVIPGSAAEYGPVPADRLPVDESEPLRPISPYGVSKAWQTLAALSFVAQGLDVRVGRLFNVIGPGLPASFALGAFGRQLKETAEGRGPAVLKTGYLGSRRDFVDVRDVADALIAIAEGGRAGEVYNVCSGIGVSVRECLDDLIEVSGIGVAAESANESDAAEILDSYGSRAKIGAAIGWQPAIALRRSLADLWNAL